jgi:hypothetical protein
MFGKHHDEEAKELVRLANVKPVQQWSRDGTQLLRTFESVEEVSGGDKALAVNIGRVCNGKEGRKTAGGFHWKFVNQDEPPMENQVLKFTKIQQWSFDGKTLIEEFATIRKASEKTGAGNGRISKCCKGVSRSAGGFKWKSV